MNRQIRNERYNHIKESCAFLIKAKNDTRDVLIRLGRKMGKFRYLMIGILFLFLFTYHIFFNLFIQMRMREKLSRALACLMVIAIVLTSIDLTAFALEQSAGETAEEEEEEILLITGFAQLDAQVSHQYLAEGGMESSLFFPDYVTAYVQASVAADESASPSGGVSASPLSTPEDGEVPCVSTDPAAPEAEGEAEATPEELPETTPEQETDPQLPNESEEAPTPQEEPEEEQEEEQEEQEEEQEEEPEEPEEPQEEPEEEPEEPQEEQEEEPEETVEEIQTVTVSAEEMYAENTAVLPVIEELVKEEAEERMLPVTWKLEGEQAFDASEGRITSEYVYTAVLVEKYKLEETVKMPSITVTIEAPDLVEEAFDMSRILDDIKVTVTADKGVFPAGSTMQIVSIREEEILQEISCALNEAEQEVHSRSQEDPYYEEELYLFDITIFDAQGNEIQPNLSKGQVRVNISGLSFEEDPNTRQQMICVEDEQVELLDTSIDASEGSLQAEAEHFSIYGAVLKTSQPAEGQIQIDQNYNKSAEELAALLVADDETFTLENIKKSGTVYTFSNGFSDIGLTSGIVLDTSGTILGNNDAQLDAVRDSRYRYGGDTSSLEFTAVANGELLNFNYVFASLEFNQPPRYNDIFGLFVKINDGAWQNIAQIARDDGTRVPVNIVNLRAGTSGTEMNSGESTYLSGTHSLFKQKNLALNGYTNGVSHVFNAQMPVNVGDTVTIKFSVCDISDRSFNSFVFIEGDSLNFTGPKKTVTIIDPDGAKQTITVEDGETFTIPDAPGNRNGYLFLGWNTKLDGNGDMYQPGDKIPVTDNLSFYPIWEAIPNTVEVQINLDDMPWSGQKVQLYQGNKAQYTLQEKSGYDGVYQSEKILNGEYDIYVNGHKTDKAVSVEATTKSLLIRQTVSYRTLTVKTTMDGNLSAEPGKVTLYQNGSMKYELVEEDGVPGIYTVEVLESETTCDVFVEGLDTDIDISTENSVQTVDFYMIRVRITDDAPWTDAGVTLRDAAGKLAAVCSAEDEIAGNTVVYSKALQKKQGKVYSVYVDGLHTHETVEAVENANVAEVSYYTARATVKGEIPLPRISMTNGVESYSFSKTESLEEEGGDIYTAEHVMIHHNSSGAELDYVVTVDGVADTSQQVINSARKAIIFQYWKAEYFRYSDDGEGGYQPELYRTVYICDGNKLADCSGVEITGYMFSCWSEEPWEVKRKAENAPFDFSQPILKDLKLYANYAAPAIQIGELIKTDGEGKMNGIGPCYRMANLSISGFAAGAESIKYLFLATTNTDSIKLLDTTGITVQNGLSDIDTEGGSVELLPTRDRLAITFTTPVSMAQAQDFLRNQVVVEPTLNAAHTMNVEVADKSGQYVAANGVSATQTTERAKELVSSSAGQNLSGGTYYLSSDIVCKSNTWGGNGLTISQNQTVYIYLQGHTLTAQGYSGYQQKGGGAGIYVPSGSTLVFLGTGTVNAVGGNAGSGIAGSSGGSASVNYGSNQVYLGGGGKGGNGGGGAGAGIGTSGGTGGTGQKGGDGKWYDKDDYTNGEDGTPGTNGSAAEAMGKLYCDDGVVITATGGSAGGGGGGGSAGDSWSDSNWGSMGRGAAGGAGGGGGGGGKLAVAIGTGGGGGAGGGGGGSAGYIWGGYYIGGGGGAGGTSNGTGGTASNCSWFGNTGGRNSDRVRSSSDGSAGCAGTGARAYIVKNDGKVAQYGEGGDGGSSGSAGRDSVAYCTTATVPSSDNNKKIYTVTFVTESETATKPAGQTYVYGQENTIYMPEYQDGNQDVIFLGWQLQTYASSAVSGSPLTQSSEKRYGEGTSFTLEPTTCGNITFVAVTETVGGIRDDDTSNAQYTDNDEALTYYTYHVKIKVDHKITADYGNIKIGNTRVSPDHSGTYTLIATEPGTKDIVVNGKIAGTTAPFSGDQGVSDTTLEFATLCVRVTGKNPGSVTLQGEAAPELINNGDGTYSCRKLSNTDNQKYPVFVDGQKTEKTASFGEVTEIAYHTVTVRVEVHGISAEAISEVELRDEAGNAISLPQNSEENYTTTKLASDTSYTVYVNGESTDAKTNFSQDQSVTANYSRYTTVVKTKLNGALIDLGTVLYGEDQMVRTGKGTYELTGNTDKTENISVDGKKVKADAQAGREHEINYYTLTYVYADEQNESGILPADNHYYLSSEEAVLCSGEGLSSGGKTFGGWKIGGKIYQPGETVAVTATTTAATLWNRTDISKAESELEDTYFVYNGTSQIPEVIMTRNGQILTEGEDYVLLYQNTNVSNGRGENNTVNAGTVTITITGTGDYTGTQTVDYLIRPAGIQVNGLKARNRIYDGTAVVELDNTGAVLSGVVDGDEVTIAASETGEIENPNAGSNKAVTIGAGNLSGAAAENYELRPTELITVDIAQKELDADFFTLEQTQYTYDAQAKTPEVSGTDEQMVGNNRVNIMKADDYGISYEANVHAGTAAVHVVAAKEGNYTGKIDKEFVIAPTAISVEAKAASGFYGEEPVDVTNYFDITGDIYTEEDRADLAIKATTSVRKGYDAKVYKSAVTVSYNTANTDYEVSISPADYEIIPADTLQISAAGYTGIYDGLPHGIEVTPNPYRADEEVTVYYSTREILTKDNYMEASSGASTVKPLFTDVGTYTVYYYAASDNYTGVGGVQTIVIGKAPLTVTATEHTLVYGDSPSEIVDSIAAGVIINGWKGTDGESNLQGQVSYVTRDYEQYGDVGTYTLMPVIEDQLIESTVLGNYEITYLPGTLNVEPKQITFIWPKNASFIYNGSRQEVRAEISGLENNDDVVVAAYAAGQQGDNGILCNSATDVGSYTARILSLAGMKALNYTFSPDEDSLSLNWEITAAQNAWTIHPAIQGWTDGQLANDPVGTAQFGTVIYTYASQDGDGQYSAEKPTAPGTYYLKAAVLESTNYKALVSDPIEFTIAQAQGGETDRPVIYVTAESTAITYGEALGEITVHYTASDGTAFDLGQKDWNDSIKFVTNYKQNDPVGKYMLLPDGISSAKYEIVFRPGVLTVEPREVSLDWSADTVSYTGAEQSVVAQVKDTLPGDMVYVSLYTGNAATVVGTYTAQAESLSGTGADNYRLPESPSHKWKIETAENKFLIKPSMTGWVYGETPSLPQAKSQFGTVTYKYKEKKEGIADWNIFNPSTKEVPVDAGEYVLIAEVEPGEGYAGISSEAVFTISKAQIVVEAQDAASEYGMELQNPLLYTVTVMKGIVTQEDRDDLQVRLSTEATEKSAAGVYPITVSVKENANIEITPVSGNYVITKAQLAATAEDISVVYDGREHALIVDGISKAGTIIRNAVIYYGISELNAQNYGTGSTASPALTNVGKQTIYYYVTADNYKPLAGTAVMEILPAEVTVTAEKHQIAYGDVASNQGVAYKGLVNGETADSLNLKPAYKYVKTTAEGETAYAAGSPAGDYKIVPGGLKTGNYIFTYVEGMLTVNKKALTADMFELNAEDLCYDGTAKEPTVTGKDYSEIAAGNLLQTSDFAVTFADNVNAGTDTAKVVIAATEEGNYTGSVTKFFSIKPAQVTLKAKPASSVYNEAISELSYEIENGNILESDLEALEIKAQTTVKKGYAVGNYEGEITVSYRPDGNYEIKVVPADYEITQAQLIITAEGYAGVYDGKAHGAKVIAKTGKLFTSAQIYYGTDTVDETNYEQALTSSPVFTEAGVHKVYYYAVCENYQPVKGAVDVAISRAPLTVTVPDAEISYGDDPTEKLAVLKEENLIYQGFVVETDTMETVLREGSKPTFHTNYRQYEDAGNYTITVTGLESDNYDIVCVSGTLAVKPKKVGFTWTETDELLYSGSEQGVWAAVNENHIVNNDEVRVGSYAVDASQQLLHTATAAGEYTAAVTALSGSKAQNYTFDAGEITAKKQWTIKAASNGWTLNPAIQTWREGQKANAPVAAAKYGAVIYTYSADQNGVYVSDVPSEAGTWYMKAMVAESVNYTGLEAIVPFEIREAEEAAETTIYVKVQPVADITYGDAVPQFQVTFVTADGIEITDISQYATGTVDFDTDYAAGNRAGTYRVVPKGLLPRDNCSIVYQLREFTVHKRPITLSWTTDTWTYDGKNHVITAKAVNGLLAGDSVEVTGYEQNADRKIQNEAVNAGTYTAHAISFAGTNASNYTVLETSAYCEWTIKKAEGDANYFIHDPQVTGWSYAETPHEPAGEAKYGNVKFVYAASAEGEYSETVPTQAGTYYMKGIVDNTENYEALSSAPIEFSITPEKIVLTADDHYLTQGNEVGELTYSVSGKIKVGDDLGVLPETVVSAQTEAGVYPITLTCKGSRELLKNYEITMTDGLCFVKANTADWQISVSGYSGSYDGEAHGITVSVKNSAGEDVEDAVIYYSETLLTETNYGSGGRVSPTLTDVGTKTVYYYIAVNGGEDITGYKEIVVEKKEVIVSARNAEITYGEQPANNGVTYTGFVGDDNENSLMLQPQFTYNYVQYGNAGKYVITPVLDAVKNYRFILQKGTLNVLPKPVFFSWSGNSYVYDGTIKAPAAQVKGAVNGDSITVASDGYELADGMEFAREAGSYRTRVTALSGEKADNYYIEADEETAVHDWEITAGTNYFVTPPSIKNWVYGQTAAEPVAETAYGNDSAVEFVYGTSKYGSYTKQKPKDAGIYFMKARAAATENYGALESEPVSFQIAKAPLTIMADDIMAKPGEEGKDLTWTMTGTLAEGDILDISLSTEVKITKDTQAGNYTIRIEADDNPNYDITTINGVYHITPLDVDISAEGVDISYDGNYHGIMVSVKDADDKDIENAKIYYSEHKLADDTEFENAAGVSETSPMLKNVGTQTVYYYVIVDNTVISGFRNIIIRKTPLTITARNKEIQKGENPKNAGVTYSGFAGGEDETFLSGSLSYEYNYKKGQPAGSYLITPYGLSSANYELTFVSGKLTVNPVQEETEIIGIRAETGLTYDGKQHTGLNGVPVAGQGAVTEFDYIYRNSAGDVIGTGLSAAPAAAGDYTVTITIPSSNVNYKGSKVLSFTIEKKALTVAAQDQAMLEKEVFSPMMPVYTGFVGKDSQAECVDASVLTGVKVYDSTGVTEQKDPSSLSPGSYVLKPMIESGSGGQTAVENWDRVLTTEAARNYTVTKQKEGKLTIIRKAAEGSEPSGEGNSVKLDPQKETSGNVQTSVIKDENAPEAELEPNLTVEMAEKLLTPEEREKVAGQGQDALIYLLWTEADAEEVMEEKERILATAAESLGDEAQMGLLLDVSLFKVVGNAKPVKITDTQAGENTAAGTRVTISFVLPERLRNSNPDVIRSYYIIFDHNAATDMILPKYSAATGVMTFEASKFSVYAVVYKDTAKKSDENNPGGGHENSGSGSGGKDNSGEENSQYQDGSLDRGGSRDKGSETPDQENSSKREHENASETGKVQIQESESAQKDDDSAGEKAGSNPDTENNNTLNGGGNDSSDREDNKPQNVSGDGAGTEDDLEKTRERTPQAVPLAELSKEKRRQFQDAQKEMQKCNPELQFGIYVKLPEDADLSDDKDRISFTMEVPEELLKTGRTYYLMTVDEEGNIVILKNESMVEGSLTFTGSSDSVYQLVYEDGGAVLSDMLNEEGMLIGRDGKMVAVSTNHCFWHWIILLLAALGTLSIVLLRKKNKGGLLLAGADLAIMIGCCLAGWCIWDGVFTIVGTVVMCSTWFLLKKRDQQQTERQSTV